MLGYLILAILAGFIAVDIIRSRPKPQPKVAKEETFVCANCKRELSKEYLFAHGLCINCSMNSYKRNKPEPATPAPEKPPKETFVCVNCKRELNKKYLYKQGMCVDCIINSPNYAKPAPAVFAPKETLKYDRPKPAIPTPEETPKETFVCPNCKRELNKKYLYKQGLCVDCVINPKKYGKPKPASSTPGDMTLIEQLKIEQGLSYEERLWFREREALKAYLNRDAFASYMISVVRRSYGGLIGSSIGYSLGISDSIRIMDELCSSREGQLLGIKPKYIETLKNFLQSDERMCYCTALEYIYHHLVWETNPNAFVKLKQLKLLDDTELYKLFKDSIPRNIDYLRMVSYGMAEMDHCTLYEFVQKIDKIFCSALEQRKLPVPE